MGIECKAKETNHDQPPAPPDKPPRMKYAAAFAAVIVAANLATALTQQPALDEHP